MSLSQSPEYKKNIFYILGKSILFGALQFSIGSVEMSSKFSVRNFSTNQETLDNAILSLRDYIIIGLLWTLGTSLIFFTNYGLRGLLLSSIINIAIIVWIYISYYNAFNDAAQKNNLQVKTIFDV
jgi:hypothetical protein